MNKTTYRIIAEWRQTVAEKPSQVVVNHTGGMLAGAAHCRKTGCAPRSSGEESPWEDSPEGLGAALRGGGATNRLAGARAAKLWLLLLALGIASPALAQTGVYTLNGGTANPSSLTETTSTADQSGILVYNAGNLTVGAVSITTSGNASSTDNSDKYGINAAILAGTSSTKGTIMIAGSANTVVTTGSVANGLFATYSGSSVTMLGGTITASGANAHGVDATYGGAITLSNVNVTTYGASSSAIATDFGGGTVTVTGGTIYASNTTAGSHSAAIYSTGTITVNGARATSMADCGGVIDGANSIILTNTVLTGTVEGFKLWKTAPASGNATVKINGGSLTATAGDAFYITGTTGNAAAGTINVSGGAIISASTGNILNVDSSSTAAFTASGETLAGNLYADSTSTITASLQNGTTLTGCLNSVKVLTIDSTSTWNATSNSVVTSLTNSGTINLTGKITTTNALVKSGATFGGCGTLSSNLTLQAGATLVLNPSTNFAVGGNIIFGGAVTVVPSTASISAGTYKLLTYSNSLSGTPTFTYSAPSGSGQTAVFSTATAGVITVTLSAPPSVPTGLRSSAGDGSVILAWNAATNATGYNVKRSTTSGGSYTLIATNVANLGYTNIGLVNGTLYYYVVSATNAASESTDSIQVIARPLATAAPSMTMSHSSGQLVLDWLADHTGWLLQAQTNQANTGLGTNWVTVSDSDTNNHATIPMATTNGSVFFRLVHP